MINLNVPYIKNGDVETIIPVKEGEILFDLKSKNFFITEKYNKTFVWTKIYSSKDVAEDNLINIIKSQLMMSLKNGYVQWPGTPPPEEAGLKFKGYRWSEVNYNGCFFRAKGKHASTFNSGEQGDAIRNIRSNVLNMDGWKGTPDDSLNRFCTKTFSAFRTKNTENNVLLIESKVGESSNTYNSKFQMVCDFSQSVPTTDYENRPRNQTIIIWRLEKI